MIVFVWYSVVMLENINKPGIKEFEDVYDLKVREAMREINDQKSGVDEAEPLQPPGNDEHSNNLDALYDKHNANNNEFIKDFGNIEENELKRSQKNQHNFQNDGDNDLQPDDDHGNIAIEYDNDDDKDNDDKNSNDEKGDKDKFQINPPLKDLQKVKLPVKQGLGKHNNLKQSAITYIKLYYLALHFTDILLSITYCSTYDNYMVIDYGNSHRLVI